MQSGKRKVVIVGTGMVGMSYAYSLLNQSVCDELVLIDVNKKRAEGEAMDLNHGLAFAGSRMVIYAGDYDDCRDADIVAISAGVAQKPGETRLDLLKRNTEVFRSIIEPVTASGFNGIFLVATNPVDIMTRITFELSGFNARRVLGSGTALDTARLRFLLGDYLKTDPRNVHAFVMGEHGDSEFVPWSQALIATKSIVEMCEENPMIVQRERLDQIEEEVKLQRQAELMELQQAIAFEKAEDMIGRVLTVMVEGKVADEDAYVARTYRDAPGIDGYLFINTTANLMTGDFVKVRVTDSNEYDLIGEIYHEFTE